MKFTIARSKRPISKKFSLDESGALKKDDGGNLTLATFDTQDCPDVTTLYRYISSSHCDDRVIIIPGISKFTSGLIVTKNDLAMKGGDPGDTNLVSRSKDCFSYTGSGGFLLLDYDPSEDFAQNDGKALSKDQLFAMLYEALPELKKAPMLWKNSSSSNLKNASTGEKYRGIKGQHIFVDIKDTNDIERIVKLFYKRLWLAGQGYIFVDKTGRLHDRTIIDKVVNSPEREIFLKAECVHPISQEMEYELINKNHKSLNTALITDLTASEEDKFKNLVIKAKKSKGKK